MSAFEWPWLPGESLMMSGRDVSIPERSQKRELRREVRRRSATLCLYFFASSGPPSKVSSSSSSSSSITGTSITDADTLVDDEYTPHSDG